MRALLGPKGREGDAPAACPDRWSGRSAASSRAAAASPTVGRAGTHQYLLLSGPDPVAYVARVVAVCARVGAGAQPRVDHLLAQQRGTLTEPGHAVDDVHDEVEAVHVVEH